MLTDRRRGGTGSPRGGRPLRGLEGPAAGRKGGIRSGEHGCEPTRRVRQHAERAPPLPGGAVRMQSGCKSECYPPSS